MKVCLFGDSFLPTIGGMELAIHHLANALLDIGCEVTVIALKNKTLCQFEHRYNLVRYGGTFRGAGRSGYTFSSGILTLMREHKRRRFDLIHCHGVFYAGSRAAFAKRFIPIPLVMTPHGEDIQTVPELGYGLRLKKSQDHIIRRNLSRANAATAISNSIKDELCFLPDKKIFIVPNGIDTGQFCASKNKFLHEMNSLDLNTKIVLSVGQNHIVKGYEYGIKAVQILDKIDGFRDLVYVIIGKNTHTLRPLVQELSLQHKVILLPQQDHRTIARCYQSAWCFFSPSMNEGLSLTSIEAMASGLPLVVTDAPGNIDIIKDNHCGLIAKSKDPLSMAKQIMLLASDRELYRRFSRIAVAAAQSYDWHKIAQKYLEVYGRVIDRSRK